MSDAGVRQMQWPHVGAVGTRSAAQTDHLLLNHDSTVDQHVLKAARLKPSAGRRSKVLQCFVVQ